MDNNFFEAIKPYMDRIAEVDAEAAIIAYQDADDKLSLQLVGDGSRLMAITERIIENIPFGGIAPAQKANMIRLGFLSEHGKKDAYTGIMVDAAEFDDAVVYAAAEYCKGDKGKKIYILLFASILRGVLFGGKKDEK